MKAKTQKEKIIQALKRLIKTYKGNINRLDEEIIARITNDLANNDLISYEMIYRYDSDNGSAWLQCEYFSEKIGKTIIYEYNEEWDEDGESLELMASSIIALDDEIKEFESKIYNQVDNLESVLKNNYPIDTFNDTVKNEIIEQVTSLLKGEK